jgi:antitoxin CptB
LPTSLSGRARLTKGTNDDKESAQINLRGIMASMTAGEDIAIRRKMLRYRAWHRGTLEMDRVLGPFADAHINDLSETDLDRLESVMSEEDPALLKWVMRQEVPPETVDVEFLDRIVADHSARMSK